MPAPIPPAPGVAAATAAPTGSRTPGGAGAIALALGALGVVFGDIGTSPLYALQAVFSVDGHRVHPSADNVYGVISLVFWAITMIVSLKYVTFIMRADNEGEGGIMALTALLEGAHLTRPRVKIALVLLGVLGASLFYGDGAITPAISVLSAVQGLQVAAPGASSLVVPITVAILVGLFAIQRFGTAVVGRLFGPVMALWFGVLAVIGAIEVASHPGILRALSPTYATEFLANRPAVAFAALGAVVLAVTGAEALYADMGHFGRSPIRRAWFWIVFPSLTLEYLAQGSEILRSPHTISNPFYLLLPKWAQLPMVVLAALATVIASQSVISGAFSVTRQAMALGFLPRLTIRQTSEHEAGQVYAPAINALLLVIVVAIVLGFQSSDALASAYGIAVTATFVLNTVLFLAIARWLWHRSKALIALGAVVFLSVEIVFFAANTTKIVSGGWLPLALAAVVLTVLTTWRRGRDIVTENRIKAEGPLQEFVDGLSGRAHPVQRVPGTAVFLNSNPRTTPLAMRANVEHNQVLHEHAIILTVEIERVPHIPDTLRLRADELGNPADGITGLIVHFGFKDTIDLPAVLRLASRQGLLERELDPSRISYFLSQMTIVASHDRRMSRWRKKLFLFLANNSANPVAYFRLPDEQTVTMGERIEV